jgi:hypothetical protein
MLALEGSTGILWGWGTLPGTATREPLYTGAYSSPVSILPAKSWSSFVGRAGTDVCYLYDGSSGGLFGYGDLKYSADGYTDYSINPSIIPARQYNTLQNTSIPTSSSAQNPFVVGGGNWTWTLSTKTLTWSGLVLVSLPGIPDTIIAQGSALMPNDGCMLVVNIDRNQVGGNRAPTPYVIGGAVEITGADHQVVLATRVGDGVYVGKVG